MILPSPERLPRLPHIGQVLLVERESTEKKTGKRSCELAIGVTRRTPRQCPPKRLLAINRGHWRIESVHHLIRGSEYGRICYHRVL